MAKRFIRISLATKFRLLFGTAALGIIAAALVVPWYFTEMLAEREFQGLGEELTRLRLNEWERQHATNPIAAKDEGSALVAMYARGPQGEDRQGPLFVRVSSEAKDDGSLSGPARQALKAFLRDPGDELAAVKAEGARGQTIYRCFRAVRASPSCRDCHQKQRAELQFQPGQLVGMIDVAMPAAARPLVWWTRLAFIVGGALAGLLAFVLFGIIAQRLILRPVRRLRDIADKVAEGDLTVRSTIRTNDELQRLGESFNEMLIATADQHERLLAANRALDLKLSELAEANVTLFQANKVKSEFLANVSHELRTPLNSIIGFADLLGEHDDERVRRYGGNVSTAAKNLLNMINDLLDLAKIEAGKADVRFDKVSVTDTCQTLMTLMKPLADKKQIDLRAELAEDVPIIVTDVGKLQQILYNLISNAIKFIPAGERVTVSASRISSQRSGKKAEEVVVSVADTGPGISEADQKHVFDKFYQADRTLTKESSGTGLGLAIAKELTALLGGRLALKSAPGHGAVFSVFLPIAPAVEPKKAAARKGR